MTKLRCVHCGVSFIPAPQVPKQAYCSKTNCQKERRRQWHKNKLQSDPDYKENLLKTSPPRIQVKQLPRAEGKPGPAAYV